VNAGTVIVNASPAAGYMFTGFSGALTATSTPQILTLNAAATVTANFAPRPDFTVTVTAPASPIAYAGGNTATYTVAVAAVNGFNGTVTLTPPQLPSGFTATFGSNTITGAGSTTVTVAAPSGGVGNIAISVTGTSGSLTHTASGGTLAIQDFTAVLSPAYPSPVTAAPNSQATWTVVTSGLNGFNQSINVHLYNGPPSGSNLPLCSGFQNTGFLTPTTLYVVTGYAQQMQCSFQVLATANGITHTMVAYLIQQGTGDFVLTQPASQTAPAGSAASFQAAYTPILGFSGTVNFNVTGLRSFATVTSLSALSSPLYGDSIGVNVPAGVIGGTYPITITATSGSITHTVVTQLIVQGGAGFSITATPTSPQPVLPGGRRSIPFW
jgi:hypothetical protein